MLLLWLQFSQRDFIIVIDLEFITIKLNMKKFQVKNENINSIVTGDSIVAGFMQYTNIWKNLDGNRFINLGICSPLMTNCVYTLCYK